MRLSLRRVIQWVFIVALLQIAVYYWTIKRPRRVETKISAHTYLESVAGDEGTCSFKTCPQIKEGMINVHLVPHSHIDVGWLKTVDQYYTGEVALQQAFACVRCTLNTTITELLKDPSRRFIFIEMKYLSRFWHESDDVQRKNIHQLIKERRLEIVNGGWVMSDAGVTMYNDIIDQHTLGFDFIRETFGPCGQSRTAWHVDQFGHSREHASLFAQMGYDSLFIGRIDFEDLAERKHNRTLEFVWNTSPHNLKARSTIFVQTTFDGYYAPPEYVFDNIEPLFSDPGILERAAFNLIKILQDRARSFKTNQLLVPMGSDFGYKDASNWYLSIDSLIQKVNSMQKDSKAMRLNLIYSTPSCYTYYANKDREVFTTKTDDFHPYGVAPGVYWTGYFTTRGGFKYHIRRAGQILQTCKQLSVFASLDNTFQEINALRDALGVMQHHDAITGTQTLLVLQDYNLQLSAAEDQCLSVISKAYQRLQNQETGKGNNHHEVTSHYCHDLNISSCHISENSPQFVVTIYSPLSWVVDVPVRLPIKSGYVTVMDSNGNKVPGQLVPVSEGIKAIPERSSSAGDNEIVFMAHLQPMSVTSFKIQSENRKSDVPESSFTDFSTSDIVIENQHLSMTFSAATGKLVSMFNKDSQVKEEVSQDFAYYLGDGGGPRPSGAYVFVPQEMKPRIVATDKIEIKVIKGDVVQEVHQKFSPWVYQIVRLYEGARHAEFQWIVGPLDNAMGREVISKFSTSLNSSDTFYTDSNGRETMKRTRAKEGNSKIKNYVSGNYHAVASRIFIEDEKKQVRLTIIPDRSQGGSSLDSGDIEIMVHRRLLFDDGLGVSEALKDLAVDNRGIIYTGKHYVCLDTIERSALLTKHLALQTHFAPVLMFTPLNGSHLDSHFEQHSFLAAPLPDNIHILTLDRVSQKGAELYLIRLEHVFEVDDPPVLSQPVELSLQNLFAPFEIVTAEETTLGSNFVPHEISRLRWETVSEQTLSSIESPDYKAVMEQPFRIQLHPMEIRTFRVQIARVL